MRIVIALGGNALLRRNEPPDAEVQRQNIVNAVVKSVAPIARRHSVVVTHGNGPQIGFLALQAAAVKEVAPYPPDVLGAERGRERHRTALDILEERFARGKIDKRKFEEKQASLGE